MDVLEKAFLEAYSGAMYEVFTDLIAKKFAAAGVTLTVRERARLTELLQADRLEELRLRRWPWWVDRKIDIEVPEEEVAAIGRRFEKFADEGLANLVVSAAKDTSVLVLKALDADWPRQARSEERARRGFDKRLQRLWGSGLDRLAMFLTIAREFGEVESTRLSREDGFDRPVLLDVTSRLHARACQVTDEVLCLLSHGFADGAMARWRTLHEIAVGALFLQQHDEGLAERYVDHEVVESYKAAHEYQDYVDRLGVEPIDGAELEEIDHAFEEALGRYQAPFKKRYGWAAEVLGPDPQFCHIEKAARIDHLRGYYRLASHNVHANPKGVFFRLGLLEESDILLAGASTAGLAEPGHASAISLLQVCSALGTIAPNLDSLVCLDVLLELSDRIGQAFSDAEAELHVRVAGE